MKNLSIAAMSMILVLAVSMLAGNYSRKGGRSMGIMVIVAYRPLPGKEQQLLELTKRHLPVLRGEGLATDRPPYAMRAGDGTIVEVFEWKSKEALESAHRNAAVQEMWKHYQEACEYVPLSSLNECQGMFAGFEPIELPAN